MAVLLGGVDVSVGARMKVAGFALSENVSGLLEAGAAHYWQQKLVMATGIGGAL